MKRADPRRALAAHVNGALLAAHDGAVFALDEFCSKQRRLPREVALRIAVKALRLSARIAVMQARLAGVGIASADSTPLPPLVFLETTLQQKPGKWRCGAPQGNCNALKSGRYTREVREASARLRAFEVRVRDM